MKILIVNQSAFPDVTATAQLSWDLARHLQGQGHLVTLVASRSLYGRRGASLPRWEQVDGVSILRVGASFFGKSSIVARALDFGLFYACVAFRVLFLPRQDASVWLTTPPFIALVGSLLRMVRGTPFVYWVMDLYPDLPVACGILRPRGVTARLLEWLDRFCLRSADHVVVLGRCMKAAITAKGIATGNISCINVWSAAETSNRPLVRPAHFREAWHVGDCLLVMYSGNFGIGHDMATIASGVVDLAGDAGIVFAFVGDGKRKAELLRAVSACDNTRVIDAPYQPRELLGDLLAAADVHLISMSAAVKGMLVPSKLYGALAAGKPVVFVGPHDSEVGFVIRESDCGTIVPNGDGAGLAEALRAYANDRSRATRDGANGRKAYEQKWNSKAALARWETVLNAIGLEK